MSTENLASEPQVDVIQELETVYASEYQNIKGEGFAIDPAIWAIIIEAIAAMLKNCMESRRNNDTDATQEFLQIAKRSGPLARFHLRRHIRPALVETYGHGAWRTYDGEAILKAVQQGSAKVSVQTAERFIQEVLRS